MYINELGQVLRVSSRVYGGYFQALRHIFAPVALRLLSPFGLIGLVFGASDDGTRETLSEDRVVVIGGH